MIENKNIFTQCSGRILEKLKESGRIRQYKKNDSLFHVGEDVRSIYLVISGYVVLRRESSTHGAKAIFVLAKGCLLNEVILDGRKASINCTALTDAEILSIPRDSFWKLMQQEEELSHFVIDSMALKIRRLYHQAESSTKPTRIGHQIAAKIWKFARDYGQVSGDVVSIPFDIRVSLLAEFVGSNRETVSREVKKMTELNILEIKNGKCRIYDMDALRTYMQYE